ncbi:hypothetical protein AB835_04705 [Candidatus Endobugula sertula]|uniref:Uncharacterized protein n=1 Tax=Candidatus Endobugula sertula TaxID=62101 RepID=A0A1D2QRL9_9GAMM|nr:hypothetical protein AB835_04705 [Candidatus Endobugula sertula]
MTETNNKTPWWSLGGRLGGKAANNAVGDADNDSAEKLTKKKGITLSLSDKHEPFGSISIDRIKTILEEEDFGELQSLFFYMMRDLKVASAVFSRREPLLALDYKITTENKDFAEWLEGEDVDLEELINLLSFSVYYGVSLIDVTYDAVAGVSTPTLLAPNFELISPRFLYAHKDKTLKKTIDHLYIKQDGKKRFISKLDPNYAVFHKHAVDIGEITDFSLASKLVWYFSLKHIALAHNLQYFDAVATPPLIAKTSGEEDDVIEALYQLKSASVGVFGEDDVIEYLNVSNKAEFLKFIEYIDSQITTTILGNTLSTGDGKTGSYSQSKTHENRQTEKLRFDAKLIAKTITSFLRGLERLNFANPTKTKFKFDLKEDEDLEKLSRVVKNLSDSGYDLEEEGIEDTFGFKIVGKKTPTDKPTTEQANNSYNSDNPAPQRVVEHNATSPQDAPEDKPPAVKPNDTLDSKTVDTEALENTLLNSVQTALEGAANYEEAYDLLLEQYTDFDINELEQALFAAIGNATLLADVEPR